MHKWTKIPEFADLIKNLKQERLTKVTNALSDTRRGKQYEEFYYRYGDESGKLRSKYIPQRLLNKVKQAESFKKSVADILVLLGGDEISRGEQFGTSDDGKVQTGDRDNELITTNRGEQITPPSTKRRKQGYGAGYIECKPIKRSGKEYKQYWYHYEFWQEGDRFLTTGDRPSNPIS